MRFWRGVAVAATIALAGGLVGCGSQDSAEYTWSNVAIGGGGYVTGITYNTTEEGLCYARTDIGGLYRRRDGSDWEPITDFLGGDDWNYIGIESVASDPVEPNRVYFAGGTYMSGDAAIFSSDDYGETWQCCEVDFGCGGNQSGRGCGERMQVNPQDNSEIWLGTRDAGLWRSSDYGESWEAVDSFPVVGNYQQESNNIGIMWIEFDPSSGDMYVGVAMTDGQCIYRTADGENFEALPQNAAGYYPTHAAFAANGRLYLSYADNAGPNLSPSAGAVYYYNTATDEFCDITPALDDGREGGFGGISVDANDPDTVVVSTLGWWSDNGDNLYYTHNGGATWTGLFNDKTGETGYVMDTSDAGWLDWGRGENKAKTGWWVADVAIDPFNSDAVTYGTGATVYTTTNMTAIGEEPVIIAFDAYGLEETAVYQMASPVQTGDVPELYSIMGDLTGFAHEDVTVCPDDAHFMKNGNPTDLDCAYLNGNIAVYASEEESAVLNYTTDGGKSWQTIAHKPDPAVGGQVAVSADGSSFIWVPGSISGQPYLTTDYGETWYYVDGLSFGAKITADRVNPDVYYATCDGLFYVSTNGGYTFESTGQLVADSAIPVSVVGEEGNVWIASTTMIMYTQDFGASFENVKTLENVDCIGFGASEKEGDYPVVYAIGDDGENGTGIYASEDKGESWSKLNDDAHNFGNLNGYITGDSNVYGRVYVATNGRGIIQGDRVQ